MAKKPQATSGDISVAAAAAVGQVEVGVAPHVAAVQAEDDGPFDDDMTGVDFLVRAPRLRTFGAAPPVVLAASPDPVPLMPVDPPPVIPPFVPEDPASFPETPPPISAIPVVPPELAPPLEPPPPPPEPLPPPLLEE